MPAVSVDSWLRKWSQEPSYELLSTQDDSIQHSAKLASHSRDVQYVSSADASVGKKLMRFNPGATSHAYTQSVLTPRARLPRTVTKQPPITLATKPNQESSKDDNAEVLTLPPEELKKKRATARRWANVLPVLAAFAKALKDSFGAMCLYSLIVCGELKLTAALLNPWIGAVIILVGIALFCISLGMEGKSLRQTILNWMSKRSGIDLTYDDDALQPVKGKLNRLGMYLAIGMCKFLKVSAPWTAALCKGFAGFGACAGCLLLLLSGAGIIASTALLGPIPWIVIGISAILGVTTALVSRYKEGNEFIQNAEAYEAKCWQRLALSTTQESAQTLQPASLKKIVRDAPPLPSLSEPASPRNLIATPRQTTALARTFLSSDNLLRLPAKHPGLFRRITKDNDPTTEHSTSVQHVATEKRRTTSAIQPLLVSTGNYALR